MISLLCSEIGRGHPFYLDGLDQALRAARGADRGMRRASVFEVSRGMSRMAWGSVRAAYRLAGRGGATGRAYARLRGGTDYDRGSRLLRLLGRDARRWAGEEGILVVDHPALVGALRGRADVWYMHGELVAPAEAIVRSAERVFVPLAETAAAFTTGGVPHDKLLVTGVCVEDGLLVEVEMRARARQERLRGETPLTLGLFSSGAEPRAHVCSLAATARAAARAGHRVLAFCAAGGRLERALHGCLPALSGEVLRFSGREGLDCLTKSRIAEIDVVVSPPHERSNWAFALGLPFLLVGPDIGPFAPLNRALLLRRRVALEIPTPAAAETVPERLAELRTSGELGRMAARGRGSDVRGFARAAEMLVAEVERRRARSAEGRSGE